MTVTLSAYVPVLVLADSPEAVTPLLDALAARPGWAAAGPMDLPRRIARLLWGFEAGRGEAGVSSLVDRGRLMSELRRMVDALVAAAVEAGSTHVVDVCGDGEQIGPFLRSVWPDAVVVAVRSDGSTGEGLGLAAAAPDVVVSVAEIANDLADVTERIVAAAPVGGAPRPRSGRTVGKRNGSARFRPTKSPMRDRVIVVLGAARSGTTWMHHMLCANPAVAGTLTGETWLFSDVAPVWDRAVRGVVGDGATLNAMRTFCDALLSTVLDTAEMPASHVCEKTPTTVWWLPLVAQLYPDAHFVHVVRDGRDVALSLARTRVDGDPAADDLHQAAREWVAAVGAVETAAPGLSRFREVRYEDLLADPLSVVGGLWEWIGVEVTPAATSELSLRATERVTPLPASGSIGSGKWQSLPDDERDTLRAATEVLLKDLGYPVDAS